MPWKARQSYIILKTNARCGAKALGLAAWEQLRASPLQPTLMLHAWMMAQRDLVSEGSAISRAMDYSLKRWAALSRYLDDWAVPINNNWAENQIRPWALGRKNWLFAGSLRSDKRD